MTWLDKMQRHLLSLACVGMKTNASPCHLTQFMICYWIFNLLSEHGYPFVFLVEIMSQPYTSWKKVSFCIFIPSFFFFLPDMTTEHSQKCCEKLVAAGAIDNLLKLIRSVSQSMPDQEVLKHALSVLRNLARYPHLIEVLIDSQGVVEIILWQLLRLFCYVLIRSQWYVFICYVWTNCLLTNVVQEQGGRIFHCFWGYEEDLFTSKRRWNGAEETTHYKEATQSCGRINKEGKLREEVSCWHSELYSLTIILEMSVTETAMIFIGKKT